MMSGGLTLPEAPSQWMGTPSITGSNEPIQLALLTLCLLGLQMVWAVEQTAGTPYLLSLGLSKAQMSLVWLAGPISGLITQPLAGAISDRSQLRWGRRRPFMVGGTAVVVINLFIIGWTAELAGLFVDENHGKHTLTIWLAVIAVFLLDFSVNVVQAACRAIIVDTLPAQKQELGNAWAARMIAAGHLLGYLMASVNLTKYFSFIGDTQLKVICFASSIAFVACIFITCSSVSERVLIQRAGSEESGFPIISILNRIWTVFARLPPRMREIFLIQFCSWLGWFNMLFYSSTWVGEVYMRYEDIDPDTPDQVGTITRIGGHALVVFSVVTLISSFILPIIAKNEDEEVHPLPQLTPSAISPFSNAPSAVKSIHSRLVYVGERIADLLSPFRMTLTGAWCSGHFLFALAMFCTPFISTVSSATWLVGFCGVSWALTSWAPFALLGDEIHKLGEQQNRDDTIDEHSFDVAMNPLQRADSRDIAEDVLTSSDDENEGGSNLHGNGRISPRGKPERTSGESGDVLHIHIPPLDHNNSYSAYRSTATNDVAGGILGIMNIFVTLPQFVMTFVSSIVFAVLEPGKSGPATPGHDFGEHGGLALGVVLALGGIGAIFAGRYTWRMRARYGY